MNQIDRIADKKDYTALWAGVCVVVVVVLALVCGGVVCGWADGFAEVPTEQHTTSSIEWCAVCNDYQHTFIGDVGSVLVCSVCDTVLAW